MAQPAAVEFSRFSAHRERSPDGERLSVSLRLRANLEELACYLFVLARNDHANPKVWAIWPVQPPGPAITSGGHFHGATPAAGHPLSLTQSWSRVTATIRHEEGNPSYDTVMIYVLTPEGKVLLARPFRI